jgi:hypothetical protein
MSTLRHRPTGPRHRKLLTLLKRAETQVPHLRGEIMLAAYHAARFGSAPPPPWHKERVEWSKEMVAEDLGRML